MNFFNKLFYLGIKEDYVLALQRNIYFANILASILVMIVTIDYAFYYFEHGIVVQKNNLLLYGLAGSVFLLNYLQKPKAAKLIFSIVIIFLVARPLLNNHEMSAIKFAHNAMLVCISLFVPLILLLDLKNKLVIVGIILVTIGIQIYFFVDYINFHYDNLPRDFSLIPLSIAYLILSILLAFMTFTSTYNLYQTKVEKMNINLLESKEELETAHEEVRQINSNLEALVRDITEKLLIQNKQLTDYAFDNAHILRGPLSSILGIAHIIKDTMHNEDEFSEALDKLESATLQLDNAVKEINKKIESGIVED